jgi:transglycosylase-like protein with SLT domain
MPRRGSAAVVVSSLLFAACSGSAGVRQVASGSPSAAATPSTVLPPPPSASPAPQPSVLLPQPDQAIPEEPAALAAILTETIDALRSSIDEWTGQGGPSSLRAPEEVVLLAMYQQRIYRTLAGDRDLKRRTIAHLPQPLRAAARANAGAAEDLISLVTTPVSDLGSFRTGMPRPAGVLRSWFEEAQRRFGVRWELLAAVMLIESKFGRVRASSSAGAQGPMQFIPSTWGMYGMGGDIDDPHDAILGAANYLHASGAPNNERAALYAYNHAWPYVDAVLAYANQMAADDRDYYAYYSWQVYVLTTSGVVRLTGPGL